MLSKTRIRTLEQRSPLRPGRFMPALAWNYVKAALRSVRRQKIYSVINIAGLAVGMASFSAEQRTREIGIRKVLGASIAKIITLISKNFLILLAVSNLIAWPLAYYLMTRLLNNYAYRTSLEVWIFAAAGATAIMVALATVCFRIVGAARANPADSLRYE